VAIAAFNGDSVSATPSESAPAGTDVTYRVTVSNLTSSAQTHVSVPVTLPPTFTLDSVLTASAGTAGGGYGTLTWSIPALAAGGSATLDYTETTDAPAGLEADTASASATSDQSATASTGSATVEVVPAADLTLTVSDGIGTVAPGTADTYTITLTDHGPSPATDATVASTFDGGFTPLIAVSSISGTSFGDLGADQFEWTGINLASGASATFSLMGNVSSTLTAGTAFVLLVSGSLPPGQIDTDPSTDAVDADVVIPAPQSISFTPPATGIAGHSATLSATGGGSANPVVFSVDPTSGAGVCSVTGTNGTTLDFNEPGTCVVDADQAGNASYAAAPTVTASIVVLQAPAFTAASAPSTDAAGQPYAYTFTATGVPAPTYALAAGAPAWLTLDATSGALSGTPPSGTTSFTYSVVATNDVGSATTGPVAVTVTQKADSRQADVSVTLSCPPTLALHSEGSCTLRVDNAGPATARFVAADIALPYRLSRMAGSRGWCPDLGMWFVPSLAPGSSATFTVRFRATRPGRGTVMAAALAANPDPSYANNVTAAQVLVEG
jgi:hypothetical protein